MPEPRPGRTTRRRCRTALLALFTLSAPAPAAAQAYRNGPPPQHRIVYRASLSARYNPLGLGFEGRLGYRYRLYESQSVALRDNFVSVGVAPSITPSFTRIGPIVEVQPLSILHLWALYEVIGYFGSSQFLQSFPSAATANFSDTELHRLADLPRGDPRKNYATTGTQLLVGATLQVKVGPIIARDLLRFGRPDMRLRPGDRVFYDIYYDLLVGDRGFYYTNDVDLLYQTPNTRLTVGLRWSTGRGLYSAAHFTPGEDTSGGPGAFHRLGPIAAYTFVQPDGAPIEPSILLTCSWWLASPYRTGRDVSQAVPYLGGAIGITGDLLPVKKAAPPPR